MKSTHSCSHGGFMLVELLTVVAIVGILAAMLIPVISNVRSSARAAQCAGNLRQIGVAARLWSADNKGLVVPVFNPGDPSASNWKSLTTWVGLLAPYTGWRNPGNAAAFAAPTDVPVFMCPEKKGVFGYGYNYTYLSWIGSGASRWVRYSLVPSPGRVVMLTDAVYTSDASQWRAFVRPPYTSATDSIVDYRHPGGTANVLWLDGHVSAVTKASRVLMNEQNWGPDVPRTETPL